MITAPDGAGCNDLSVGPCYSELQKGLQIFELEQLVRDEMKSENLSGLPSSALGMNIHIEKAGEVA